MHDKSQLHGVSTANTERSWVSMLGNDGACLLCFRFAFVGRLRRVLLERGKWHRSCVFEMVAW